MKRFLSGSLITILLLVSTAAFAAEIFNGYAGTKWGTDLHKVMRDYPNGQLIQFHSDVLYKQVNPNETLAQRIFIFKENKLTSVSVKFSVPYVKKTGIDKILAQHKKSYGDGKLDRSGGPHMTTFIWEGAKTRISFAYAAERPDMTVMLFEQK